MTVIEKRKPRVVPSRDEKYMALAHAVAGFSKDPYTQIGAVIVSNKNIPLGWGYNGPPKTINDNDLDWSRPNKNQWMVHGEINAIHHSNRNNLEGATLYVTAPCCSRCILEVASVGIGRVLYSPMKYDPGSSINEEDFYITKNIAAETGVIFEQFSGNILWLKNFLFPT